MNTMNFIFALFIGMILLGAIAALDWIMEKGIDKWEEKHGKTLEQILRSWEEEA